MSKASEILEKTKEIITNPDNWCTEACAKNRQGLPVSVEDSEAVSFCSYGALVKVTNREHGFESSKEAMMESIIHALDTFGISNLGKFNDSHSHAEVLKMFDIAIKHAKSSERVV